MHYYCIKPSAIKYLLSPGAPVDPLLVKSESDGYAKKLSSFAMQKSAVSTTLSDKFMTMREQYRYANEAILACFRWKDNHGWSNTCFHRIARNNPGVYQGNIAKNRIGRTQLKQLHPNWIHSESRSNHEYQLLNSKIRQANQSPRNSHKDTKTKTINATNLTTKLKQIRPEARKEFKPYSLNEKVKLQSIIHPLDSSPIEAQCVSNEYKDSSCLAPKETRWQADPFHQRLLTTLWPVHSSPCKRRNKEQHLMHDCAAKEKAKTFPLRRGNLQAVKVIQRYFLPCPDQ